MKPDEEVACIRHATEDYVRKCQQIDPEELQRLMSPKAIDINQEERLRWHERLNHIPHVQIRNF